MKELKLYDVPRITSVQDMVLQSSQKYANKIALEDLNPTPISKLTYSALLNTILKFGAGLKKLGVKERTHIAVIGENRTQWALTYLTSMCFNYVIVPIDRNLKSNEILNIIHESDSEVFVFSESYSEVAEEARMSLKKLKYFINMDALSDTDTHLGMVKLINENSPVAVEKLPILNTDEVAEIIFTSGSLGRAKGVMLSQKNIASNLMAMVAMFFIYPEDKFLSVLPMHHTYECTCGMLCPLYCGASAHYARSLKTIVEDLQQVRATVMLGIPLLFDKMFKKIYKGIHEKKMTSLLINPMILVTDLLQKVGWKNSKKTIFAEIHNKFGGSIRVFIAGGAAMDPVTAQGLTEFGFLFIQGYGLTETSPIVALNRLDDHKHDAAGIPLPNLTIKINEPDQDGVGGEIWVKGPSVMIGYYKNETITKDAFEGEWFKTGDLGYLDAEGFIHINGRKKNVIISKNGKNVFPEEIEDVLNRSPFVLESLVYGEKDPKQDEIIAVKIVPDSEAFIEIAEAKGIKITPEFVHEIISDEVEKTNKQLPAYKHIRKFIIRNYEFEKTTTQKIKRYLVKEEAEE